MKTAEDMKAANFVESLNQFQIMMKAVSAKSMQNHRKMTQIDNDIVAIMDKENRFEDRLVRIERAFALAGVPGFKTPWYKRLFRVKDPFTYLNIQEKEAKDAAVKRAIGNKSN